MDKIKTRAEEQFVFWDNGKKVTLITKEGYCDYNDIDCLLDTSVFHLALCNLRDSYYVGVNKNMTFSDLLELCLDYRITDISYVFDGCNTLEEKIKYIKENCFDFNEIECAKIINSMKFDNFVILPVWAVSHSGIHLHLYNSNDSWDGGFAGFVWSDYFNEQELKTNFEIFSDFNEGCFNSYYIRTFALVEDSWILQDDYWDCFRSFEECWDCLDFTITDEVDKPDETLYNEIRNKEITEDEIISYLKAEA